MHQLRADEISRIIEMAWEDRTPFDAIKKLFGLDESAVIKLMRGHLRRRAFCNWRQRVSDRKTKHVATRSDQVIRAYCPTQYKP